jgi:phytoene dehydrogenase-like protein
VGLTPYAAPAVFSLLQAIELNQGVFYPRGGGFGHVARALLRLVEGEGEGDGAAKGGVECRFDTRVQEVVVEDGRARGVRLADGACA